MDLETMLPYVIETKEGRGRCMIATRNIKQGEVIVVEKPFGMIVSPTYDDFVCAHCGKISEAGTMYVLNPEDTVKYCSEHCITVDYPIHNLELDALKLIKKVALNNVVNLDSLRLIIRCGCIRKTLEGKKVTASRPNIVKSTFEDIMALESLSSNISTSSMIEIDAIVDKLDKICKIRKIPLNSSEIKSMLFAIQGNAHRITIDDRHIALGLFPTISMINHSCVPNCTHYFELSEQVDGTALSSPRMIIRAISDIPTGTEVVYSYVPLYQTTASRRAQLKAAYSFECTCAKCANPDNYIVEDGISSTGSQLTKLDTLIGEYQPIASDVDKADNEKDNINKQVNLLNELFSECVAIVKSNEIAAHSHKLLQTYVVIANLSLSISKLQPKLESNAEVLRKGVLSCLLALGCIYRQIQTIEYETVTLEITLVKLLDTWIASQVEDNGSSNATSVKDILLSLLLNAMEFPEQWSSLLDTALLSMQITEAVDVFSSNTVLLSKFRNEIASRAKENSLICRGKGVVF